jgi:regulator of sigma E protease
MLTILLFFVILLTLVLVHEFGHFMVAKLSGMRVDEFAFGFPPRLFSKKKGETEYSFNLIPLGGYVKIFGENGDEDPGTDLSRAFSHQAKYKQILVLIAGVTMNLLLAWALLSSVFMVGTEMGSNDYIDSSLLTNRKVVVSDVFPRSPADTSGLKALDQITSVQAGTDILSDVTADSVTAFIGAHQEESVTIRYIRNNAQNETSMTPVAGIVDGKKVVGISTGEVGLLKVGPLKAISLGAITTYEFTKLTFVGFYDLLHKLIVGQGKEATKGLTGPVGIVGLVGDAQKQGAAAVLAFTALISINLAVLNILPLPALDGGRVVFVLIEAIRKKPISFKTQNIVNGVSFVLLLVLMLVVTARDVLHLIH